MNPLQNPTYQKARDLINLAINPDWKIEDELGEGCYVRLLDPSRSPWGDDAIFLIAQKSHFKYSNEALMAVLDDEDGTVLYPVVKHDCDVLGLPIPLSKVLMALEMAGIKGNEIRLDKNIVHFSVWLNLDWNLEHPLHLQTPETWEKLLEVLSVNS